MSLGRPGGAIYIASCGDYSDSTIILWDAITYDIVEEWRAEQYDQAYPSVLEFSPNGELLVTSGVGLGDIEIRNTARPTHSSNNVLSGVHRGRLTHCAWSPSGTVLASAAADGSVCLWDLERYNPLHILMGGHAAPIDVLVISPSGEWAFSGGKGCGFSIWRVQTGRLQALLKDTSGHELHDTPLSVVFDSESKFVISVHEDGMVHRWFVQSGTLYSSTSLQRTHGTAVEAQTLLRAVLSRDGRRVCAVETHVGGIRNFVSDTFSGSVLWDLDGHCGPVEDMVFSRDGKYLATSSWDCAMRLWSVNRRRCVADYTHPSKGLAKNSFAPGGEILVTGAQDGTVNILDIKDLHVRYMM